MNRSVFQKIARLPRYANRYMQAGLSKGLSRVYGLQDSGIRRVVEPTIYGLYRWYMLAAGTSVNHTYVLRGKAIQGGMPLSVALVGNWTSGERNILPYFQHILFEEGTFTCEERCEFPNAEMHLRAEAIAGEADLVIVVCNNLLAWKPERGDWMLGPEDVHMVFDFQPGETWKDIERRMGQEYNLRMLRRSGLTYTTSTRDEDFTFFYHQLYLPLVRSRYKDYGSVLRESGLYHTFKAGGFILQIRNPEGEIIAGGLQYKKDGVAFGLLNGVLEGSQAWIKKGALTAWYYFGMQWAFENGYRRFDSGACAPFSTDGVYIHKHRWGCRPVRNLWKPNLMLVWAPDSSPTALAWMKAYPLLPEFSQYGGENLLAKEQPGSP